MAEQENIDGNDDPAAPDLSFIPETFKGEDGAYKVEDFKAHWDDLTSFKSQADEAAAAMPTEASAYAWAAPEDHAFPEGFDPALFPVPVLDDKGEPVMGADGNPETRPMTAADMVKTDDPDLPLLQEAMFKHGAKPELMGEIASILANRELRSITDAGNTAKDEIKKLGPEGQSRIDTVKRSLAARMTPEQSGAVLDSITSADALRGIEALIKSSTTPPAAAPGGNDLEGMSNKDLIALGMKNAMSS